MTMCPFPSCILCSVTTLIKKVDPDAEEDAAQQPLHLQEDEGERAGHLHHQGREESCLPTFLSTKIISFVGECNYISSRPES